MSAFTLTDSSIALADLYGIGSSKEWNFFTQELPELVHSVCLHRFPCHSLRVKHWNRWKDFDCGTPVWVVRVCFEPQRRDRLGLRRGFVAVVDRHLVHKMRSDLKLLALMSLSANHLSCGNWTMKGVPLKVLCSSPLATCRMYSQLRTNAFLTTTNTNTTITPQHDSNQHAKSWRIVVTSPWM